MFRFAALALAFIASCVSPAPAQGTAIPFQNLLTIASRSCVYCAIQYASDVQGCPDDGSLDPEAAECRVWAYEQFRACSRTCWDEDNLYSLVFGLWESGLLTSDQMIEILTP